MGEDAILSRDRNNVTGNADANQVQQFVQVCHWQVVFHAVCLRQFEADTATA